MAFEELKQNQPEVIRIIDNSYNRKKLVHAYIFDGEAGTGKLDRVLRSESYTAASLQAAEDALNGVDPVEGCLYFGCGRKGIKIGAHYFH